MLCLFALMAKKRKVNPPLDGTSDIYQQGGRQSLVYRTLKPKNSVLVADEWERRVGWRDLSEPKALSRPYVRNKKQARSKGLT
jgi:hypothetical protein